MSKRNKSTRSKDQRLRIRSIRRNPPDLKKLAGALIELAQAQAEADAQAQQPRKDAVKRERSATDDEAEPPAGGAT